MKLSEQEFCDLRRVIHRVSGIALADDKQYLIESRVEPVLHRHDLDSYASLVVRVNGGSTLLKDELIEAITTKETSFNRDGHPFEALRRSILPELIRTRYEQQSAAGLEFGTMRIWSAAASTGQEPYSLAMTILDHVESLRLGRSQGPRVAASHFLILATDISQCALDAASAGVYTTWEMERGLSDQWREKYFTSCDDKHTIHQTVRNLVSFRPLNMIHSFGDMYCFDLVLCRNLLIYFDEPTRRTVIEQLSRAITPSGVLMLGAAESIAVLPSNLVQERYGQTIVYRPRQTSAT